MKAKITLDCEGCIDDLSLDITIKGRMMPRVSEIMRAAQEQGWRVGRSCYCPSCYRSLPAHCNTCAHYEGNKSMGAPVCRRDGGFAAPTDYCEHHRPFSGVPEQAHRGYQNPIPVID